MALNSKRRIAALSGVLAVALTATACGSCDDDGGDDTPRAAATSTIDCAPYEAFGDLTGKTVTVYTSITAPEDAPHIASYKPFEECTGVTIKYEGSKEFEAQLPVRVKGGNAPDIAYLPQPGLLKTMVATGEVKPAPPEVVANVDKNMPDWKTYGTVDGTFYAAPLGANVKSFVWYSPPAFEDKGYEVPKTWAELLALSDKIAADNPGGDVKPWCAGIESGDATGWPATDWIEDVMLRTAGPETYDKWVNHEIPFNDPAVADGARRGRQDPQERQVRQRWRSATSRRSPRRPSRTPASPIVRRHVLHAPPGVVLRGQLAEGHHGRPTTATCGPSTCRPSTRAPSRSSAAASSPPPSPTVPRSRPSRPTSPRPSGPTSGPRPVAPGGCVTANKNADPALLDQPGRQALGRDPHRQGGDVPLRRLGPHAGRRRCGHVLEGHDQLDHRQGRQDHARLHRAVLAGELTPT